MSRVSDRIIVTAIIAIILGIVLGILFYNGIILTATIVELTSFLIPITIIGLILLFILASFGNRKEIRRTVREYGDSVLGSGIISLILGIVVLALVEFLVVESLRYAFLVGLLGAAFSWFYMLFVSFFSSIIKTNFFKNEEPYC